MTARTLEAFTSHDPAAAAVIAAAVLAALFMAWQAARRLATAARNTLRDRQVEDLLTVVAAGMATAVAANGMWRFFGSVLHFSGAERAAMFGFLELAVVTCAFRARRNMRSFGSAAAEGLAVWVLAALSAVFSALDARSGAEAVFRLAPPLVAAWLWHRAMALEQRRSSGRGVHWRLTLERILVAVGLAEPSARAASDVDAHRRIARLARAAKRLRERRASGARPWRQDLARRLDKAMEAAVEHAGLASDAARQDQMRDQIGALNAAEALAGLDLAAPWDRRQAEAAEIGRVRAEAAALADEAAQMAEARIQVAAQESSRLREWAHKQAGEARSRICAVEQSLAAERARAATAERELGDVRTRAAGLAEALARAESGAEPPVPDVDRDALVAELAGDIRAAATAGDRWRPDYDALMVRTSRQRRWCEYVVRDARNGVFRTPADSAPQPAPEPARAGGRAELIAAANGHHPPGGGESSPGN